MNRSACVFASLLGLAACNDPTNIGEQATDGTSGTGSTSDEVHPSTSGPMNGSASTNDNPSASSQGGSATTDSTEGSTTTGDPTETGSSSEETGQIDPPDGSNVAFLNFGGVTLTQGADNASQNTSGVGLAGELAPFQSPEDIPEIVASVEAAWAGINLVFVTERPASGEYTMVVITPTNTFSAGVQGVGPLDCNDTNPSSVAGVFTDNPAGSEFIAAVISRELGFTYGLETIDSDDDFMNGNLIVGTEFVDSCHDTSNLPGACAHVGCADGEQNSYGELVSRLAAK